MSGFFTGILKISLLLSVPISGKDVNEERIDQPLPFNESLLIYNEASKNLKNVSKTIADLNEAIKETTKLKNEVKKFFIKLLKYNCIEWGKSQKYQTQLENVNLQIKVSCE